MFIKTSQSEDGVLRLAFTDEVDPYAKPADLLEVSPKGLVPALRFAGADKKSLHESTVMLEYLEEWANLLCCVVF